MTFAELEEQVGSVRNQRVMAALYARGLNELPLMAIDWNFVNDAIIRRWSVSGLLRIKNQAWKLSTIEPFI